MTLPRATVIVCSHNPRAAFLERALAALRAQTLPVETWELLLVDNASTEPLATRWDLSWHPGARHLHETQLGVLHARLTGLREARAELIVYVDDDNLLQPDYLVQAVRCAEEMPWLGVWGGAIVPEFVDGEPPAWTRNYWYYLALRDVPTVRWCNFPGPDCVPAGAGMCLRRRVTSHYLEICRNDPRRSGLGRRGQSLAGHEDTDMVYTAPELGLGYGLVPELRLTHLIPGSRLSEGYLQKMLYDSHRSYGMIKAFHGMSLDAPASVPKRLRTWLTRFRHFNIQQRRMETAIDKGCADGAKLAREALKA